LVDVVNDDCLKLTVHFGESDRIGHELLSDALLDVFERHKLHAAVLMRAVEGFGIEHQLRTDRLLTLSEDLPLVSVAVDERARIEAVLGEVTELVAGGLITLERARLLHDGLDAVELPQELDEATKLTVYLGRDERVGSAPAFVAVVDHLHRHGLAGATVLLGVDGMAHRRRQRARFFSRNEAVPVMIVSVGAGPAIAAALPGLDALLRDPIVTLERVRVCKRDGVVLAEPLHLPEQDDAGLGVWQKLMVYAGVQARHAGHPLYVQLVRRLREAGASGATSVRGIWGFSGDHPPHGDRLFAVRRDVPVVTTIVDRPEAIRRWFTIVDACTDEAGLVTSEMVPAFHAVAPERHVGGLSVARLRY
jgi:PII-like signaling protein